MASMRDIKQRINNIRSTEQIIKAMDTISSTKLHKAKAQLEGVRPIYYDLKRKVEELKGNKNAAKHVFYTSREIKHSLYIVITSDSGFAGAYNSNILFKALTHMNKGKNENIFAIGLKGFEYFKKRNKNIVRSVSGVMDSQVYYHSESLSKWITEQYLSGQADEVFMVYTHFENLLNYTPKVERILPITAGETGIKDGGEKKYEPDLNTVIEHTVPFYVHMNLFRAFSESHTSEQAARMVNMDAAGKNASELIEDLTKRYNRERQAAITQELSEIIGGSNL